ncbi:DUF2232 domain-containing protein [Siccirubricoccus sp. G192]|uniref:DUF2232 domain-containing protein n=1 Tax=Siccirubricoccus sp. G192 TaxID=2849651 RepID=UPI0020C56565|nr:DUF2232 domain-containing protein [Siccirubricoccus sp. G192]
MQPRQQGVLGSPGLLAAGAAGFAAAVAALWAFRGLPMGTALFWMAPFPLFAAGLGFGAGAAVLAAALATLLVGFAGGGLPALVFLVLFAVPVPLLLATGLQPGRFALALPVALLGLWPVAVLLAAALLLPVEGGLEAAMRNAVEAALARMGMPAPDLLVAELVRVKAAAIGFWTDLALLANAAAAQAFLARRGLALVPRPDWAAVRLPGWYPVLPAVAAGLFLAMPGDGEPGGDAVPLSALLMLLIPLFLQGLAGVHLRAQGRKGRTPMLALFYVLLVLFLQVIGPALVGLGLYDQFRRRRAPQQG